MRKGLVILRPPTATLEVRAQVQQTLADNDWSCDTRERFDGVMIVAFERDETKPESSVEEIETLLKGNSVLEGATYQVKAIEN